MRLYRWARKHPRRSLLLGLILCGLLVNLWAYNHAHAMTHYRPARRRTRPPGKLTRWQKLRVIATGISLPRPVNRVTPRVPYETHRFETADGLRLEAWHIPARAARGLVLLFHGYADSKAALLPEARSFRDLGWSTLLVDFRGSGGSTGRVTTIGYRESADVAAAVRFARERLGVSRPVLFGQSMGSAAILRAVGHDGVSAGQVILEMPFDELLTTVGNRFEMMGLPVFPGAHLLVFWGGAQHGYWGFDHAPVDYAASVTCPALVLNGTADRRARPADVRRVFDRLAGQKRLVWFDGVAHAKLSAADPARWSSSVRAFLSSR